MKLRLKLFAAVMISLCISLSTASAASKSKKEITTERYMSDIDCAVCAKKIMDTLPFQKGIKDVKVDLDTKIITVKYDKAKSSDQQIITSLKKVDVAAQLYNDKVMSVDSNSSHEGHNH